MYVSAGGILISSLDIFFFAVKLWNWTLLSLCHAHCPIITAGKGHFHDVGWPIKSRCVQQGRANHTTASAVVPVMAKSVVI